MFHSDTVPDISSACFDLIWDQDTDPHRIQTLNIKWMKCRHNIIFWVPTIACSAGQEVCALLHSCHHKRQNRHNISSFKTYPKMKCFLIIWCVHFIFYYSLSNSKYTSTSTFSEMYISFYLETSVKRIVLVKNKKNEKFLDLICNVWIKWTVITDIIMF
jgi:hypothetical protein